MSRIAKSPVTIPAGVTVKLDNQTLSVKGSKGSLEFVLHDSVAISQEADVLTVSSKDEKSWSQAGTARSLINNMIIGVSTGFERKLQLVGVGYRAKANGNVLNLSLGFSHPLDYQLPEGITAETPSNTEIVLKGIDKQALGQAAAEIRAFRAPEPYKGKGVRYADEHVRRKEAKKK